MSESGSDKTEQATPKRLEEALKRGQFPRSVEVQTVFVLGGGLTALSFTGAEIWGRMVLTMSGVLGHLHQWPVTLDGMQAYFIGGMTTFGQCVWPVAVAGLAGGLLAGGMQSRFRTASEALEGQWERVNPIAGLQRMFSVRSLMPAVVNAIKLAVVIGLSYGEVMRVLDDPIFFTAVSPARIAEFMTGAAGRILWRVGGVLVLIALADYAWQVFRMQKDMMMTKEEVKEEGKASEGNPEVKAQQKRKRMQLAKRKMFQDVPKADVILVNPTHIAIALRYDRKTMKAPVIVAKGSRLNALRIREIAGQHQIPILENKPLARMLFKYGRVGGEIPAQFFAAVAEVLAWVYRVNRYRYYMEGSLVK